MYKAFAGCVRCFKCRALSKIAVNLILASIFIVFLPYKAWYNSERSGFYHLAFAEETKQKELSPPRAPSKPTPPTPPIPPITIQIGEGREGFINSIRIVLLLTILTLAPSLLILMTSFTRIVIVLFLLRQAIGIVQVPPNQVLIGLALFLSIFIMKPALQESYSNAFKPYSEGKIEEIEFISKAFEPFKKFMLKQVGEKELDVFLKIAGKGRPSSPSEISADVLIPAFIISEIKRGFEIGFLIYIPFIIIDIVIASILMAMGMIMVPPIILSVPFKLIAFVVADGWTLLTSSLVGSFIK
ncbi:Flagellar biosynthetic protein FliP [bacterium HR19]|nr:Flagellar biosynthetic protein FliP [bacterium HR19]